MSYFGGREDAIREGEAATKVLDDELTTSPVRDGGGSMDVGGAPIANNMGGGHTEFSQDRTRTGIQDHEVGKVVRQYGQQKKTAYK
jgi:hypothetical protein